MFASLHYFFRPNTYPPNHLKRMFVATVLWGVQWTWPCYKWTRSCFQLDLTINLINLTSLTNGCQSIWSTSVDSAAVPEARGMQHNSCCEVGTWRLLPMVSSVYHHRPAAWSGLCRWWLTVLTRCGILMVEDCWIRNFSGRSTFKPRRFDGSSGTVSNWWWF